MAVRQLVVALRRHAVVVLLVLLATAAAVWTVGRDPGAYEGRAYLIVKPPASYQPNPLFASDPNLVAVASVLERSTQEGTVRNLMSSNDVTLAGLGVRHGYSIRLLPGGNQWVRFFDRATLDVQAVGSSPEEVRALLGTARARIEAELARRQDAVGAPADQRLILIATAELPVTYLQGHLRVAQATTATLGLFAAGALALLLERTDPLWWSRRRRPRATTADAAGGAEADPSPVPTPAGVA